VGEIEAPRDVRVGDLEVELDAPVVVACPISRANARSLLIGLVVGEVRESELVREVKPRRVGEVPFVALGDGEGEFARISGGVCVRPPAVDFGDVVVEQADVLAKSWEFPLAGATAVIESGRRKVSTSAGNAGRLW
jgi:hypothetical protein